MFYRHSVALVEIIQKMVEIQTGKEAEGWWRLVLQHWPLLWLSLRLVPLVEVAVVEEVAKIVVVVLVVLVEQVALIGRKVLVEDVSLVAREPVELGGPAEVSRLAQ